MSNYPRIGGHMASGNGVDEEKSSEDMAQEILAADAFKKEPMKSNTHTLSPRNSGLLLACILAFHFYNGYLPASEQLDTRHFTTFLSDIHGDESYKHPVIRIMLDKLCSYVPFKSIQGK